MNLYCLSLKNIWKILIIEGIFSVLFCISMAVFLQIAFFLLRSSIYTRIGYKPYLFPYYLFLW